jgi:hypothetical protein
MHTAYVEAPEGDVGVENSGPCDLLLRVSNESYLDDPVGLTVVIDGTEVLSQPFEVRNQHHFVQFPLLLGPGTHELRVVSSTGVVLTEEFLLPVTGERQHADISYYNYADEDGKLIDWSIRSTPMGVM